MSDLKVLVNLTVDEYTTPCHIMAGPYMPLDEVMRLMVENDIRHIPVVDQGRPVGMISDRDLKVFTNLDLASKYCASDLMVPDPYQVVIGTSLSEVVYDMSSQKIGSAIVVNLEGKLTGIFTSVDALNALVEILRGDLPEGLPQNR